MDVMGGFLEDMLCLLLCILPAYHIEQKADGMTKSKKQFQKAIGIMDLP